MSVKNYFIHLFLPFFVNYHIMKQTLVHFFYFKFHRKGFISDELSENKINLLGTTVNRDEQNRLYTALSCLYTQPTNTLTLISGPHHGNQL